MRQVSWVLAPGTEGPRAAMTTGDCCHLPGSLCDCPGSAALSKSVEDSDIGRPQYITQVTAKDGRLLSTVIKALGAQSDGPICRICHEGGNGEGLLSPCDCTGTLGTVHKSCLEKWLSSSNTSYCELCHTEFVVERRPRPLTEWLKDPGPRNEKRTLFCDMVCFLFITPLAAISGWLCLRGAQDHLQFNSRLEAIGLIALTIALFTIYVLWTLHRLAVPSWVADCLGDLWPQLNKLLRSTFKVSFRYHCQLYSEWRRTNQKVRLMIPASRSPHPMPHSLLSTKLMKKTADETTV
ncbi:E3 ubiquitin-protein ligase MARCHF2 isoform 3-T4 [Sylvia borin]